VEDWITGVRAKRAKWKKRLTDKGAFVLERAKAAEDKWADKMRGAIEAKARLKALEKVTPEAYNAAVEATAPEDYSRGAERRLAKYKARIAEIRDMVNMIKNLIAKMPEATEDQRERKMLAARRCMIVVGQYRKGIITRTEAESKIREITA